MSQDSHVRGKLHPSSTPSRTQLGEIMDAINGHELGTVFRIDMDGTISAQWRKNAGWCAALESPHDFASRLAALAESPALEGLGYSGELVVLTEGDNLLPNLQRLNFKAGSVSQTPGAVIWHQTSSMVSPAQFCA